MRKLKLFFSMALATAMLVSCNNDDDTPNREVATPNEQNFKDLRAKALENLKQTAEFQVDGVGNITFTSKGGVEVVIPEECLHINGNGVTGTVKLDFVELYNPSDILATNVATMGYDEMGQLRLLVTGGAFNIHLTQNGNTIQTGCNYSMKVPASNTGGVKQEMDLWYGFVDENGDLSWNLAGCQGGENPMGYKVTNNNTCSDISKYNESYYLSLTQFGWINCDYFYGNDNEKTEVAIKLPQGYNNKNTEVFFAYKGVRGIMRAYDKPEQQLFMSYPSPIGIDAYVIVTSESNGKWAYTIKPIKIEANQRVEILKSELKEATGEEFNQALINTINN